MKYYAIINGAQLGPLEPIELARMGITAETPVWCEGMPDWAKAGTVAELQPYIATPQPQPQAAYQQPQPQSQPQYAPGMQPQQPYASAAGMPSTHLAWSIVVTILCCLPFGIVAIVKSTQVSSRWMAGDYDGARRASQQAATWCIVSAVASVVFGILYYIFLITSGIMASLWSDVGQF